MKKLIPLVGLLISCSSDMYIFTDYDKSFDVTKYESYSWSEIKNIENNRNPIYYNELNDKRIKVAVNEALAGKGYKEESREPCFVLHYHIVIGDVTAYHADPMLSHEAPWMRPMVPYYRYKEGSLIFDVMDMKSNSLIWRGYASQILVAENTPLTDENIKGAVKKIFRKFPARNTANVLKSKEGTQ
ncbi:MAG: DUF4136 domain-containing protein [Bacteroidetes bacterium]|nr:DUF4136 domain-containing protein [Bacteroidota bacterium]MBI3482510.1 DUF4136 domain-containing protein [Bacteroidota bacterium]